MKKIKTYFNKTSIIDNIEIQTGGLTLQDVVDKYGKELNADAMEELATTGKYWDIMINLTPGASYTLVVEATNNYGKKKLIVCEPFVTDIPPARGNTTNSTTERIRVSHGTGTLERPAKNAR